MAEARVNLWGTVAITALGPATWGTTYIVTTQWLPADRPLLAATVRALPAGLLMAAAAGRLPQGVWWWRTLVLGTLNIGLFFALLFFSAYRLPGGVAATLGAVQPLFVALMAVVLLNQRLSARTLSCGVLGLLGVALLVLRAELMLDPLGIVATMLGAAAMALGVVLTKRWGRPAGVGIFGFTGWMLTAGGLVLLPVTLLIEGLPSALTVSDVAAFTYLAAINTGLGYFLWLRGIDRLAPTSVSLLGLTSPLVATAIGWVALGERLSPAQALGMAVVLASMVLGQRAGRTEDSSSHPSADVRARGLEASPHRRVDIGGRTPPSCARC